MNRIIIIVTEHSFWNFQNVILLGSNENVQIALKYFTECYEDLSAVRWDKYYKILLDKSIQDVSVVKNKINYLNSQKQVLFFDNNYGKKISFIMTNCTYTALYYFGHQGEGVSNTFCKHTVVDKNSSCYCYNKLLNKLKTLKISNPKFSIFDIGILSIKDFILELNLSVEPLWKLAAAQLRRSNIKVNKTNASEFAIWAVNEYNLYDPAVN